MYTEFSLLFCWVFGVLFGSTITYYYYNYANIQLKSGLESNYNQELDDKYKDL